MNGLGRRLFAEFLGTMLLVTVVVGSGVAAERLAPESAALELLVNAFATALGLTVIIAVLQPISGAHLNPVISLIDAGLGARRWGDLVGYVPAQVLGAIAGAVLANLMFATPPIQVSSTERLTAATALGEFVATAGLVIVIFVLARSNRSSWIPPIVGAYIGAAYFFTSSTSFANPAVTIGRIFTDTYAGIAPLSAFGFVGVQIMGAVLGATIVHLLTPATRPTAVDPARS